MIFWDTSALVPLLVDEPRSAMVTGVAQADPLLVVWWASPVECISALARREREGGLTVAAVEAARDLLTTLRASWVEVVPSAEVRAHAERLLGRHPLRAADALQLGAALAWADSAPTTSHHAFASLDDRLATAARREGFRTAL